MKALSLNPPYGTLIAVCERFPVLGKHIETRDRWNYTHRGPLLIHQTKGLGEMFDDESDLAEFCAQEPFRAALAAMGYGNASDLPRGAIVAVCRLFDCEPTENISRIGWFRYQYPATDDSIQWHMTKTERAFGNYAQGRKALLLADIRALPEPIPAKGALGLWDYDGELPL